MEKIYVCTPLGLPGDLLVHMTHGDVPIFRVRFSELLVLFGSSFGPYFHCSGRNFEKICSVRVVFFIFFRSSVFRAGFLHCSSRSRYFLILGPFCGSFCSVWVPFWRKPRSLWVPISRGRRHLPVCFRTYYPPRGLSMRYCVLIAIEFLRARNLSRETSDPKLASF